MSKHNTIHEHSHEGNHCEHGHCHHHHEETHGSWWSTYCREIICGVLLLAAIILQHFNIIPSPTKDYNWIGAVIFLLILLPVGWPVVVEMVKSWRRGSVMNEFTLMVAATIGAFIIGEFPEGVAVLLFYSFGEKLEDTAGADVKRRIRALLGKLPNEATVIINGVKRTMKPQDVHPGTIISVLPGERVPVDGKLLGNEPMEFDTSSITGESVPRAYKPGEEVMSGMIPVDRAVTLESVREFSDSSMTRIMKMIEDAQSSKSPTENMLRRITRWYTPIVFIAAVLVFFIPWIVSAAQGHAFEWYVWFKRSLVFLVCSCPCALVMSIPLSYFASLGNASRHGLLFKGSKYVDALRSVDTVVFDKTGTLTTGEFHISGIAPADGVDADTLLSVAAGLDAESSHPLAKAIIAGAKKRGIKAEDVKGVKTVPHGITGILAEDGKEAIAGSEHLMRDKGIALPERHADGSEICVAVDGKYIGSIYLLDTVKPEAARAIAQLHKLGVKKVEILSGDRQEAVERVRREIDADSARANLLPADKLKAIDALKGNGHKVAFVGDGINDAPAIAASDVGVAMGTHGTDVAMESADVVISGDQLTKLPVAIRLARKVRSVVTENVSFALSVKLAVMVLGAFGIATLWAAVFADTGVTLITVIWTMLRLRK